MLSNGQILNSSIEWMKTHYQRTDLIKLKKLTHKELAKRNNEGSKRYIDAKVDYHFRLLNENNKSWSDKYALNMATVMLFTLWWWQVLGQDVGDKILMLETGPEESVNNISKLSPTSI